MFQFSSLLQPVPQVIGSNPDIYLQFMETSVGR